MNRFAVDRIIHLIILIVFFFQLSYFTTSYLNYNTISRIDYIQPELVDLPAITLCFETSIPLANLLTKLMSDQIAIPINRVDTRLYEDVLETFNISEEESSKEILEKLFFFAEKYFVNDTFQSVLEKESFDDLIRVRVAQYQDKNNVLVTISNKQNDSYGDVFFALDTVADQDVRCLTYFSEINRKKIQVKIQESNKMNKLKNELKKELKNEFKDDLKMYFTGRIDLDFLPIQVIPPNSSFLFGIHSANSLPQFRKFAPVDVNTQQHFMFSKVTIHHMKPPYKNGCRNYDLGNPNETQSHSDCVSNCVFKTRKEFHFENLFSRHLVYRKEMMDLAIKFRFGSKFSSKTKKEFETKKESENNIELSCKNRCLGDCIESFYMVKPHGSVTRKKKDGTSIFLTHDQLNDIEIQHLEEISLFAYMGTIGGLAGIYLGFSFVGSWKFISAILARNNQGTFLLRRKAFKVNSRNLNANGNRRSRSSKQF